ncbi:hypothetical protein RQP46_008541 [Phenoliferia psychrophenolica]
MTRFAALALVAACAHFVAADVIVGAPNPVIGAPSSSDPTSPVVLPVKSMTGEGGLEDAFVKAKAFVAQLTLPELFNLTTGTGLLTNCSGTTGTVPRLGFAGICLNDGPIGARGADNTSAFPSGISTASTFDRDLMRARGEAMGAEFRGKGIHVQLGPGMNMMRSPNAARNFEMAGGDPFLAGVTAEETILGIQSQGVAACAKHFIDNDQDTFRGAARQRVYSANVDDRTQHEIYAWPFAQSVKAGVASVMCSYNMINNTYGCENSKLLNGLLKEELNFQGFVVSDWLADNNYAEAPLAGLDLDMPGAVAYDTAVGVPDTHYLSTPLGVAYSTGVVPIARIEDMVTRLLPPWMGLAELPDVAELASMATPQAFVPVQGDHAIIIREIGAASAVLLKNTAKELPYTGLAASYGLFGSDAAVNPAGINSCPLQECDTGHLAQGGGSGSTNYPYLIDPISAITDYVKVSNPDAIVKASLLDYDLEAAASLAATMEKCLVFVTAFSQEGTDRTNISLYHNGDALIHAVASNCAHTSVIMNIVGPVIVTSFIDHPNVTAVLNAQLPGQESGNSLVDIIFGAVNPSGRLPYTMGKLITDYAAQVDFDGIPDALVSADMAPGPTVQINYTEALLIDHRWFDVHEIEPSFPFGFGLSYTTFDYGNLTIESVIPARHRARNLIARGASPAPGGLASLYDDVYTVTFDVKNVGDVDGNEVSQLYLGFPPAAGEPPKILRGFERTMIQKGETASVSISLNRKAISIWDVISQAWVVPSGTFTVLVGRSSRDLPITGTFTE